MHAVPVIPACRADATVTDGHSRVAREPARRPSAVRPTTAPPARRSEPSWVLLVAAPAVPCLLLGIEMAADAPGYAPRLIVALASIQLAVGIAGYALHVSRRPRVGRSRPALVRELRAYPIEAALAREQERLHELRATVGGLALASRLLREGGDGLTTRARLRLEHLHESELGRLERLLDDHRSNEVVVVDLGEIVDPLVEALRLRGHRVHWTGTRLQARGRRDEIAEVIHILLENAARHAGQSAIHVEVLTRRRMVEARVRDSGPGVPPDLVPVLFERGARAADSPGEGIGLHIGSRLAQGMGGRLRFESVVGAPGACFVLSLPITAGARSWCGEPA